MTVFGGDVIFAADVNDITPVYKIATATQTVISSTTYVDSTYLFTPTLDVGSQYEVRLYMSYNAGTTGDIKVRWSNTGTMSGNRFVLGASSDEVAAEDIAEGKFASSGQTTDVHYGVRSANADAWLREMLMIRTVTVAGILTVQFAQFASEAVNTNVTAGSFVKTSKVKA